MTTVRNASIHMAMHKMRLLLPSTEVGVLMYHQITNMSKGEDHLGLSVSPQLFDSQMKLLLEAGFRSITLDDLVAIEDDTQKSFRKVFILTFDDGYLDSYTNAFPILLKYGLAATVFLITNCVGETIRWGTDKPAPLMTWGQAIEMSKHGISFQSHTCTHPDLTKLDDKRVLRELQNSKKRIEDAFGHPVHHLAYPSGKYDERIIELVKKIGYQSAYSAGLSGRFRFARERLACNASDIGWRFKLKASAWGSWLGHIRNFPLAMFRVLGRPNATDS